MIETKNAMESLESRNLMAAHVVGSPVVYPTIQAAVNAALPGATVKVDAGTYNELVTINKPLKVIGAQGGVDARSYSRGKNESIIDGQNFGGGNQSTSFYVTANDVTIDGFTVQDDTSSNVYGAGIVLAPSIAGTHVVNNIVRDNVAGLYLSNSSSTDAAVIQHNVFAYNNNAGNNNGRGIYTDGGVSGGNLTNVLIDANTFTGNVGDGTSGNPEAAVGLEAQTAGKQSNITITNNIMTANGKGLLAYNVTGLTFSANLVAGSTDTASAAVRFEGNVVNATVKNNTILGDTGAAVRITNRFVGPSSNIIVQFNNFAGNADGGVIVDPGGYTGTLDARFNYWGSSAGPSTTGTGPGQFVSAGVLFSNSLVLPSLPPLSFIADNGIAVSLQAQAIIIGYAISLKNLALLLA